jgi:cytochrome P450
MGELMIRQSGERVNADIHSHGRVAAPSESAFPPGYSVRPGIEAAGIALTDPMTYTDDDRLHRALALLRKNAPVHRVEAPGYEPFWAITRHADVLEVERDNSVFRNGPRQRLAPAAQDAANKEREMGVRTLIHLDGAEHRARRAVGAPWFQPAAMRAIAPEIDRLAQRYVEQLADFGGQCDFVEQVAMPFALSVIMSLLGLPESDFALVRRLTQQLFKPEDQARRGAAEDQITAQREFFGYFHEVATARRIQPREDLASAIAHATVDGRPLSDSDTISYYVLMVTAGHDTVGSTIAGGLQALIEYPDQLDRLRRDPGLLPSATDEMIRWVTPTKGFMRTADIDHEVRGVPIRKGDALLLCYPSANRDEDVFEKPFRFDVGRTPNRHLSFGYGVHQCLGARLARLEIRAFFSALLPRLRAVELAGAAELAATTFVGGLTHLPIRYRLGNSR